MNYCYLLLFIGITCRGVVGENDTLVKKNDFPYMAYIFYLDPAVVDAAGARFVRSAVLVRTDWLVTAALGPSVSDSNGFPKKTLLARAGAVTIDVNFTLNEDEYEQEREVVQIVRPFKHSVTQWWTTDISLMKILFPFNTTLAVGVISPNVKRDLNEKTCIILVFAKKFDNITDEKALMKLFVEVLPATMDNCGQHFSASTMTCASDSNENKGVIYDPNYCQGNSGGPLICEGELMGLQTYIDNNCKQPHLYQLLSAWDNFITCGIDEKCQEEHCSNICDVTYKDPPINQKDVQLGNSGGPLICGELGLQIYIENNCKQPHLYQLVSVWDNFITCGIDEKCQHCSHISDVTYKDPSIKQETLPLLGLSPRRSKTLTLATCTTESPTLTLDGMDSTM